MKKKVFTITKIYERDNEYHCYYVVTTSIGRLYFFYDLIQAEKFVASRNATYNYKEEEVDWLVE